MADTVDKTPRKKCFVVGPIGASGTPIRDHADWVLKGIIEPLFKDHFPDFDVVRSDQISEPGMIDSQMINLLFDAELVIADMTTLNANAFYEIGIRHTVGAAIVHLHSLDTEIPFDVKPHRSIPFSIKSPQAIVSAQGELKSAIEEILKPGFKADNPVTRARGAHQINMEATPAQRLMMNDIADLKRNFESLGNRIKNQEKINPASIIYHPPKNLLTGYYYVRVSYRGNEAGDSLVEIFRNYGGDIVNHTYDTGIQAGEINATVPYYQDSEPLFRDLKKAGAIAVE